MAEQIDLTVPEVKPANPRYRIAAIHEDWIAGAIEIDLLGANGETKTVLYSPLGLIDPTGALVVGSPTGAFLLKAQNKMNFSVNSRQKRIYQQLIADGVLAGTVSGAPE